MSDQEPADGTVPSLKVSAAEALVLFDFLARRGSNGDITVQHPAEDVVLSSLLSQLESVLVAPFRADYDAILAAARNEVSGESSGQ